MSKKEVITGSATYEGETHLGMKHGEGTLTWDDGDMYVGEFKNDKKTNGTFRWKGGDTYTGEWHESLMHGKGRYTYKNGRTYEGDWVAGYKQGKGIFTWPIGDKYEGEFFQDQCHGVGIMTYADGRGYKGEWAKNKKHGFGTLISHGEKIQGQWVNSNLHGTAIFTDKNQDRFEETYENGTLQPTRIPLKRKDSEMELLLKKTSPPAWAQDSEHKMCFHCNTPFSLVNRRHHCRHCGLVFCGQCTSKKIAVPRMNFQEPIRVCTECYIAIATSQPLERLKSA